MIFTSPIWLLALLPWTAVVVWLLRGRPQAQSVPFLDLWRGPAGVKASKWQYRRPPMTIVMGMLAMLLAILAAGGPGILMSKPKVESLQSTPPTTMPQKVSIVRVGVRQSPMSQVMVRVRNQSVLRSAVVEIEPDNLIRKEINLQRTEILLPGMNEEKDYFLDVPKFKESAVVRLHTADEVVTGNEVQLVRRSSWPRIEPRIPVSAEMSRMIDVYEKQSPSVSGAKILAIVADIDSFAPGENGICMADGPMTAIGDAEYRVASHPITQSVDWKSLGPITAVVIAPPAGYSPIVSNGHRVLVAVSQSPRRVWIGFEAPSWSRTPEFVIFWANVFNWANGGEEPEFITQLPNSPAIAAAQPRQTVSTGFSTVHLAPALLLGALFFMLLAVVLFPGRRLTPVSGFRTV